MYVCVCINCVYLFYFVFFFNVWVLLPFDGEIKMYMYHLHPFIYRSLRKVGPTWGPEKSWGPFRGSVPPQKDH